MNKIRKEIRPKEIKKEKTLAFKEKLFAHYWFVQDSILLYFIQGLVNSFILLQRVNSTEDF